MNPVKRILGKPINKDQESYNTPIQHDWEYYELKHPDYEKKKMIKSRKDVKWEHPCGCIRGK